MREARSYQGSIALQLGLAGLVAAGCAAQAPLKAVPDEIVSIKRGSDVRLINEGGPVFAMPGEVLFFASTAGIADMKVTAERIDGSKVLSIPAAQLSPEGTFELHGPLSADLFFATTIVEDQETVFKMRALVRAEDRQKIIIDTASTLVAADVLKASRRHQKAELGAIYTRTAALTHEIRMQVPEDEMRAVNLSGTSDVLVSQLHAIAGPRQALYDELRAWEEALQGTRTDDSPLLPDPATSTDSPVGEPPK